MPGSVDYALMAPAKRVVEELMEVHAGERVVLVHDTTNTGIARALEDAAVERRAWVERIALDAGPSRPWATCPPAAIAALEGAAASILAIRAEEAEYAMRCQFVEAAMRRRLRHVHMIGVSDRAFIGSMSAAVPRVLDLIRALSAAMGPTTRLAVRSAAGTDLEITMAPHLRWFANGAVLSPGQWVTVPYGAVLTSPATVQGTYVVDASMAGEPGVRFGLLSSRAIRLVIDHSVVRFVECSEAAIQRHVERFVSGGNGCEKVGLLGLGANVGIPQALGELHYDVNMPGVHLSLGETFPLETGATWRARAQLGFAMANADVDLDGAPLIRRGRFVRFV